MKIAVLVSGEYRSFAICSRTMGFLERHDVFFSTWTTSTCKNTLLNLHENQNVTEDLIKESCNPIAIALDSLPNNSDLRYNSFMVDRWIKGVELIDDSYSHVVIIRPDLFFANDVDLNCLVKDETIGCVWLTEGIRKLQDIFLIFPTKLAKSLLTQAFLEEWNTAENTDWHSWLYEKIEECKLKIESFNFPLTWGRLGISSNSTFADAIDVHHKWRDSTIAKQILEWGMGAALANWPKSLVDTEVNKIGNGFYSQQKKIGIIICGQFRKNSPIASLSLPLFGAHDFHLVTWDDADNGILEEYTSLNAIKSVSVFPNHNEPYAYLKMLWLWNKATEIFNNYDALVLIRPDVFYWGNMLDFSNFSGVKTRNHFSDIGISDQLVFVDKDNFQFIGSLYEKISKKANDSLDIHYALFDEFKEAGILFECQFLLDQIFDMLIVRDTFHFRNEKYCWETYRDIFYDTAAWWKRTHGGSYMASLKEKTISNAEKRIFINKLKLKMSRGAQR